MIGVTNGMGMLGLGPDRLKRDILFFDKISIIAASGAISALRDGPYGYKSKYQAWATDIEFLVESGHVLATDTYVKVPISEADDRTGGYATMCKQMDALSAEMSDLGTPDGAMRTFSAEESDTHLRMQSLLLSIQTRMTAAGHRIFDGTEATPIDYLPGLTDIHSEHVKAEDVLMMSMRKVPLLSELTSWQQVLEMKSDDDLTSRARKLRLWARDLEDKKLTAGQAEEYLEDLLSDYERYLRLHSTNLQMGIFETVVIGSAEFLESLIKLRLGKDAKSLFQPAKARNDFLLAELEAPGREVSLIAKLRG